MVKRILHLTLKKKWFDLIALEKKTTEYREIKPYWTKRLVIQLPESYIPRVFDEVHFRNGYSKNSPFMRVVCRHIYKELFMEKMHYAIRLGAVLEIRNWHKSKINRRRLQDVNVEGNNGIPPTSKEVGILPKRL